MTELDNVLNTCREEAAEIVRRAQAKRDAEHERAVSVEHERLTEILHKYTPRLALHMYMVHGAAPNTYARVHAALDMPGLPGIRFCFSTDYQTSRRLIVSYTFEHPTFPGHLFEAKTAYEPMSFHEGDIEPLVVQWIDEQSKAVSDNIDLTIEEQHSALFAQQGELDTVRLRWDLTAAYERLAAQHHAIGEALSLLAETLDAVLSRIDDAR